MSEVKKVKLELPDDMILPEGCELPEIELPMLEAKSIGLMSLKIAVRENY